MFKSLQKRVINRSLLFVVSVNYIHIQDHQFHLWFFYTRAKLDLRKFRAIFWHYRMFLTTLLATVGIPRRVSVRVHWTSFADCNVPKVSWM